MNNEIFVTVDLNATRYFVGRLWVRAKNGRESATFEYSKDWLRSPQHFPLEPLLQLVHGPHHTRVQQPLFGSIGDSAPDRWGRMLMRRAERSRAAMLGETPRTLWESDYLLGVNDVTRIGALRFSLKSDGPFLSNTKPSIPTVLELPQLLTAADNLSKDKETDEDIRLLLAPGSSLGGARPKASILNKNKKLSIAKFPHKNDYSNTVVWEAVALTLAQQAGIRVPNWQLETVLNKPVLISERFDRVGDRRIPYLSAMGMLGAIDNEQRSYLEIADAIKQYGAQVNADLEALWRRIIFNIMIANTDDHLRNHAFLCPNLKGWVLSPAYDLNPTSLEIKPRVLSTAIDTVDGTGSIELAKSVAAHFHLSHERACTIENEVRKAAAGWYKVAKSFQLKKSDIAFMSSAFDV